MNTTHKNDKNNQFKLVTTNKNSDHLHVCIFTVPLWPFNLSFCVSEKIAGDEKRFKVCDTFDLVN